MDRIHVNNAELRVRLGVPEAERAVPQSVFLDLAVEFDIRASAASDDFTKTIDYAALHAAAVEVAGAKPYALVETLAESIAAAILARFPVESVHLTLRKPGALQHAGVAWAGVEITRRRHD